MKIIAHRGAGYEAPQNSRESFEKAIEGGAQGIEIDARLSADGIVYINHDDDLLSATGHLGQIEQLSSRDLKAFHLSNGESLPRLKEIFEIFGQKVDFTVEIKTPGIAILDVVVDLIEAANLSHSASVSSFNPEQIKHMGTQHPEIEQAIVWSPTEEWLRPMHRNLPEFLMSELNLKELWPRYDHVDKAFMELAHKKSWTIYPWLPFKTDDRVLEKSQKLWSKFVEWGVHGLCTNYPRELAQWLSHHP